MQQGNTLLEMWQIEKDRTKNKETHTFRICLNQKKAETFITQCAVYAVFIYIYR